MANTKIDTGPFLFPMPIVLVGAQVDGAPNYMTAAFVGIANFKPTVVACGLSPTHRTCDGIVEKGCFSLNLPSADMVEVTDYCGLYSGRKVDKEGLFDTFYGELETAPMIGECALNAECRLVDTIPYAVDTLYLGEVVNLYARGDVLTGGEPDWRKIEPLIFTFPDKGYWRLGEHLARAWKVGKGYRSSRQAT